MRTFDVVIIGAGSVGLPLSWKLAESGLRVAVIDHEASWGRGQNRAAIGGIRATHSEPAKIRICLDSIKIISSLEEEYGLDVEWNAGGYLYLAYDEERETAFRKMLEVQKASGLDIGWIGPAEVESLAPGIRMEGLRGGTFSPGDGYASPLMAGTAFHKLALSGGVQFFFGSRIDDIRMRGHCVESVSSGGESWSAGLFVNAAGAEAQDVAAMVGLSLPVHPDCHEAGVTEPVRRFLTPMVVDIRQDSESGNYYFYQSTSGQLVFCITPSPQIWGRDKDSTSSFLPICVRRMLELYPRLRSLRVRRTWRGMYPMTPDGVPMVGYAGGIENLLHAVGMCGQGFMMGPGLAKILSESIQGGGSFSNPAGSTGLGYIFDELACDRDFEHAEYLR